MFAVVFPSPFKEEKMLQAPSAAGTCGRCGGVSNSTKNGSKARRVADLEQALRDSVVPDTELICDECIRALQPVPRTDTVWALERKFRSPRCAANGWDCERQRKLETRQRHTETLLCIGGLSLYHRRKAGIADYAVEQCLCRPCYRNIITLIPAAEDPPQTPARSRSASHSPAAKRVRSDTATTDELVRVLCQLPDAMRARIAGFAGATSEGSNHLEFSRLLEVSESSARSGTAWRAFKAVEAGTSPEELFATARRGPG